MLGLFGWKVTLAYIVSGVLIGTIFGIILGKMKLERHLVRDLLGKVSKSEKYRSFSERFKFGLSESSSMVRKLWFWILVGVGIGALIHNYVPADFIQGVAAKSGVFGVPIAVILGVPIYGSCAAIVPIALVLFQKGLPLGTSLAFMMAISALSLPEAVILRRAMKLKLIVIFFGIVSLAMIITGYLFNYLEGFLV